MNKILKWVLLSITFFGCSTPGLYISDIQNLKNLDKSILIYSLPQTVLNIEVEFRKLVFIPGPYHDYADKYLAIKGVSHNSFESWNIKKIVVGDAAEPDPDYFFSVGSDKKVIGIEDKISSLAQDGLILLPESNLLKDIQSLEFNTPKADIYFKDLSVKRNLMIEKETAYKRVFRDSTYMQVPFETELLKVKSLEKKAEEAANFIIKLRKRKFKLLTGQNEGPVPDMGIQVSIDEINRIEEEYLSLFIGKSYEETSIRNFEYIPSPEKEADQRILFRISETEGIFDSSSAKGKPFNITIRSKDVTSGFDRLKSTSQLYDAGNTIFYRLPDLAHVVLKLEDRILFEGKFTVFQFGPVISKRLF